jgi:tRNA(fMet)-specific endonuclease VapC
MLMDRALLDTDTFSEISKAKNAQVLQNARSYRDKFGHYTISVVTLTEVVKGLQKRGRLDRIDDLILRLSTEEVLPLGFHAAVIAGRIYGELERAGQTIGRADPYIAGIAIASGLTLVTGNTRHFERIVALGFPLTLADWRN